jgi:acyl carrier protein
MSSLESRVRTVIAEHLHVKEEAVRRDASIVDDLGADSVDTVELIMALEEEFEVDIPDEDAVEIETVQETIEYVMHAAKRFEHKEAPPTMRRRRNSREAVDRRVLNPAARRQR